MTRIVPDVPPPGASLRLVIDTDAANEIDDLYAVALALASPDRFRLEGFVATHFAAKAGPESTEQSYQLLLEELRIAGREGQYPVLRGGHPMQYPRTPSGSEGADFLVERALAGNEDDPLWIVCLGAATNLAAAVLTHPEIVSRVRLVFHARNEFNWPGRTTQFNVMGDVIAAQTLLACDAPLVWFDTGTALTMPMQETASRLAPLNDLGRFLHEFRHRSEHWAAPTKGFFDLGDIAWLVDRSVCQEEVVPAPTMARHCAFDHERTHGKMRRVHSIDPPPVWALFLKRMERFE